MRIVGSPVPGIGLHVCLKTSNNVGPGSQTRGQHYPALLSQALTATCRASSSDRTGSLQPVPSVGSCKTLLRTVMTHYVDGLRVCSDRFWLTRCTMRRYENLVQVRLLLERLVTPEDILARWHELLPEYMAKWQLDRADVRCSDL